MMAEYCSFDDFFEHPSLIDPFFIALKLVSETRRDHFIEGWYCVAGIYGDGRKKLMFDVWCGFDKCYFDVINTRLFMFCQKIGVQCG